MQKEPPVNNIGEFFIGKYKLWITPASLDISNDDPSAKTKPYYWVLVSELKNDMFYFVDLSKPDGLNPMFLDTRKYPTSQTNDGEYTWYLSSKDGSQPLIKLTANHVNLLLDKCAAANL